MLAAKTGSQNMVECILDHGANVRLQSDTEETAYSIAVGNDHQLIALLLADVNVLQAMRAKDTPTMMNMIHKGADPNIANAQGWTPLIYLTHGQMFNEVKDVVVNYKANVNAHERDGWTALMFAAYYGHVDTVKLLMQYGADVQHNSLVSQGKVYNAISLAIARHHAEVVKILSNYRPVSGLRAVRFPLQQ